MIRYSRGEVLFLLSLTRDQAIDLDAVPRDSCSGLSNDDITSSRQEEDPLPVIARWIDVQRAKRRVIRGKEGLAMVQLRAGGFSETEIARLSGRDRLAVRRRWQATLDEILTELGGEAGPADSALSRTSLCIKCGERPRARLDAVMRRVRGKGMQVIQEERQAGVCVECIAPELVPRIHRESPVAA